MVLALSDIDGRPGSPTYGMRTTPSPVPPNGKARLSLRCSIAKAAASIESPTEPASTILWIEDAGRAHPDVSIHGAYSTRFTPVSGAADPINMSSGANGRRVFAWADADAVSNGYSGPSNAVSPGSRVAQLNNYASPDGGPPECRWSVNNCGPNDEPFAFHPGGVNATMGDGSVRFLADSIDGVVVKWMVGAEDGETINENL